MSVLNKQTFVAVVSVNQTTTLGREEVLVRSVCEQPPKLNLRERFHCSWASKLLISLQPVYCTLWYVPWWMVLAERLSDWRQGEWARRKLSAFVLNAMRSMKRPQLRECLMHAPSTVSVGGRGNGVEGASWECDKQAATKHEEQLRQGSVSFVPR